MKHWIFFFLLSTSALAQGSLRSAYATASQSKKHAEQFFQKTQSIEGKSKAIDWAYKGAANMIYAQHVQKLEERKKYLQEGVQWIEKAVAKDPENPEIRFVRLSIQEHIPKVVKYKASVAADRAFLQEHLTRISDIELKTLIQHYLQPK